jgi:hypothetical protein
LAIAADDDPVGIFLLAVGEFAADVADDHVRDHHGLPGHAEEDSAIAVVGHAAVAEFGDAPVVEIVALGLEIGAAVADGRALGIRGGGTFVPVEPEPAHALEDDVDGRLGIAGSVGVFDAQDEGTPVVPGKEPVEQRRTGTSDVEVTRR